MTGTFLRRFISFFFFFFLFFFSFFSNFTPSLYHRYQDKVKKFAEVVYDRGIAALQRNDDEFNVINHGDSWTNNMMYRYDENSKPVQHVFVSIIRARCFEQNPAIRGNERIKVSLTYCVLETLCTLNNAIKSDFDRYSSVTRLSSRRGQISEFFLFLPICSSFAFSNPVSRPVYIEYNSISRWITKCRSTLHRRSTCSTF